MDEIDKWTRKRPVWLREFFAEFLGTFFIVCIGDAAVANYLLNKDNTIGVDHFAVCFAFGVGVLIGVTLSIDISGAHLNPAVTLAFASIGGFPLKKIPLYFAAQYSGAFTAAFCVFCAYYEGINAYDGGERMPYKVFANTTTHTGGIFSTYPAPYVTITGTIIDQILATFLLMFAVMAVTDKTLINTPKQLIPMVFAFVITGICTGFGLNCGAVLNPARDLGPRLFQLVAGYGITAFKPVKALYWITAGIIGPHLGGILGAWIYKLALSQAPEKEETSGTDFKLKDIYSTDKQKNLHKNLMDELEKSKLMGEDSADQQNDSNKDTNNRGIEVTDNKNIC